MTNDEFRKRLDAITTDRSADLWLSDIEDLGRSYPHAIRHLDLGLNRGFNCFAFALGLVPSVAYFSVASRSYSPNVHASSAFVRWLLDHEHLQSTDDTGRNDQVVVYFAGTEPTHAGQTDHGQVVSKWGTGHWFRHGLFEVPSNYGLRVEHFARPETSAIEAAFLEFANLQGVPVTRFVPDWRAPPN